jgi:hypothetical protein
MQEAHREDATTHTRAGRPRVVKDRRTSRSSTAAPALVVGSLAIIVGSFLNWIDSRDQATSAANGFQIPDGRLVLGIGVALLLMGILMASNRRVGTWFDADLLASALSTVALVTVVTLWVYLGSDQRSPDVGIYVAAAGALVTLGGSLMALLRSASDRATWDEDAEGDVGRNRRLA